MTERKRRERLHSRHGLARSDSPVGVVGVLLLVASFVGCLEQPESVVFEADPTSQRETRSGRVVGFDAGEDAHGWRGIPFAAPPVGPLRWRAPRAPEHWSGTLEALQHGPGCAQFASPAGGRDGAKEGEITGSEDCLVLDVYAPKFEPGTVPQGGARLPVMYWIHGGGNTIGDTSVYDGSRLAATQNVIVVTVQYRLGAFGWFAHSALRGKDTTLDDRSGNFGTLDLIHGLEWVRRNIAAFGGDPKRVTVFGESAGGANTFSMLLSPRAEGLFHRAIVESGGTWMADPAEAQNFSDDPEPGHPFSSNEVLAKHLVTDGRASNREAAKQKIASMGQSEIASYLRGKSTAEFLSVYEGNRLGGMYEVPRLLSDGVVLPALEPMKMFRRGTYNRVPVILGTNRDENKLFMLFGSDHVTRIMGIPIWINDGDLFDSNSEYAAKGWKLRGVDDPAEAMRNSQGASVFGYRFDWDESPSILWLDMSKALGASHAIELPFVFGWVSLGPVTDLVFDEDRRPAAERLSKEMMSYWSQFAYTGDPGRGRDGMLPPWSSWSKDPDGEKFMILDTQAGGGLRMSGDTVTREGLLTAVSEDGRLEEVRDRCEVYHGFVRWARMLSEEEYQQVDDAACVDFPLDEYPWRS